MSKIELNIPPGNYPEIVRVIVTDPLRKYYGDGAWEAIENPATSIEDLKNALKILEEKMNQRIREG